MADIDDQELRDLNLNLARLTDAVVGQSALLDQILAATGRELPVPVVQPPAPVVVPAPKVVLSPPDLSSVGRQIAEALEGQSARLEDLAEQVAKSTRAPVRFGGSGANISDNPGRELGIVSVVQPVSVDDNGGSLTVDGAVSVSNFPATQPVSDGGASLTVDGSVAVSNFPATQPVSDGGATLSIDDGGGSITVDGTVSLGGGGSLTTVEAAVTYENGAEATVDTTADSIVAANASRKAVIVQNTGASITARIGVSGVSATTGIVSLPPGAWAVIRTTQELFGVTSVGSTTVLASEIT